MATSVASGASTSTFDCMARPKPMMAMPQKMFSTTRYDSAPLRGSISIKQAASRNTALTTKICGLKRCTRLNSSEPMMPAPPNTSKIRVTAPPPKPATPSTKGSM
ncbi:hypothetical protein [Pseudomonas sp. 22 E 5]|nr:hypothetical protein [Pseudomonas sp. 22 E 5]